VGSIGSVRLVDTGDPRTGERPWPGNWASSAREAPDRTRLANVYAARTANAQLRYIAGKQVSIVVNTTEFFATAVAQRCLVPVRWWVTGSRHYRIGAYQRVKGRKATL
jgi:hypothetical protein